MYKKTLRWAPELNILYGKCRNMSFAWQLSPLALIMETLYQQVFALEIVDVVIYVTITAVNRELWSTLLLLIVNLDRFNRSQEGSMMMPNSYKIKTLFLESFFKFKHKITLWFLSEHLSRVSCL